MQRFHAVVWLDHREARVFFFDRHTVDEVDIAAHGRTAHLHHHAGSVSGKRAGDDHTFFDQILEALKPAQEWLVTGPGTAKLEFVRHVHERAHAFEARIVGVETADHPTDRQIVAHARAYFQKADAMRPLE